MIELHLHRFLTDDDGTLGDLSFDDKLICNIGELPWRDNKNELSCIPSGKYHVEYMERSASGKYRDVYHVLNVSGRSGVLIHPGNFTGDKTKGKKSDSWGCLLPGKKAGKMLGQRVVLASHGALQEIHAITNRKDFILNISWSSSCLMG